MTAERTLLENVIATSMKERYLIEQNSNVIEVNSLFQIVSNS